MHQNLGPVNALYPSLTVLIGTEVDGCPNFLTVAHVGIMNHGQPQYLSFGINKRHYSIAGIRANGTFSVNIPSLELMRETDYCGLVSGRTTDKSGLFELFSGATAHAPMIRACPVCMECRLDRILDFETHDVFIGEIIATHAMPAVLTDGKPDPAKVRPLLFDMQTNRYYALGAAVGQCWSAGKTLKHEGVK